MRPLNFAKPQERQRAMDRLTVGVAPTIRGTGMKQRHRSAVEELQALRDAGISKQAERAAQAKLRRKSALVQQVAQREATERLRAQRAARAQAPAQRAAQQEANRAQARDDILRAKLDQRAAEQEAAQNELVRRASTRWATPAPASRNRSPPRNLEGGPTEDGLSSSAANLQKGERYVNMDHILLEGIRSSTALKRFSFPMLKLPKRVKTAAALEQESEALAEDLLNSFKAGLGDPFDLLFGPTGLDDNSSSEEEWDPKSKLPYMPRRKLDKRLANALIMIAAPLGRLERELRAHDCDVARERLLPWPDSRLAMQVVAAEIVSFGAAKRSMEREEVGPAPHGFSYVQVHDEIFLTCDDGEGSMVYVGDANQIFIRHKP
ncbi:hypothetical protein C8F04DRAFT_1270210 [Mycena alexandri]|uniref:Uncharacterized protein n=1 Tax=Mycena alexandri TaxID=1745969 RepID=A0AAD6SC44_9AGAR|nr:hypothetical protein C8F04DRAFT_1270210 [Mycena alexandri]